MQGFLVSAIVLGSAAIAALVLTRSRPSPAALGSERSAAARALAIATLAQAVHFAEETFTGFPQRFPALFGLPEMSPNVFVVFNLLWLGIWISALPGLRSARPAAFFAAWFLALGGMLNGIAHPLLALAAGGYFPGVTTSTLVAVAALWLWLRLRQATPPAPPQRAL